MSTVVVARQQDGVAQEILTAVRHSAVYGLGAVAAKAIGFLMLPVYTRYLSPADYGVLEILDLSMSLLGMFLNMGITAAMLRYYAMAKSAEEKKQVVSTALWFVIVTGAVVFCAGTVLCSPVSEALLGPGVPARYLMLSFSSFVLAYIANVSRTYLRAIEASGAYAALDTVSVALMLTLNIVFVVVLQTGLAGILMSALIVNILVIALSVWVFRHVGLCFSLPLVRQMLDFGAPLILSNLALFTLNFADRFFLQRYQSLETVGIYAVGYKFAFMMNFLLVQPFYVMWQARMYVIHRRPDHGVVFGQFFVMYTCGLTFATLAMSLFSSDIVRLMVSPRFASSQNVIPIVSLAYMFHGLAYYAQTGLLLARRTRLIGAVSAVAAVVNLALNLLLIPTWGMMGAGAATLAGFFLIAAGCYWCSQRVYPLPLHAKRAAAAILTALGLYVTSQYLRTEWLAPDLLLRCLLLAAFPVLVWKARIISATEAGALGMIKDHWLGRLSRAVGTVPGGGR